MSSKVGVSSASSDGDTDVDTDIEGSTTVGRSDDSARDADDDADGNSSISSTDTSDADQPEASQTASDSDSVSDSDNGSGSHNGSRSDSVSGSESSSDSVSDEEEEEIPPQALQGLMREREPDHKCREKCYMQVLLQTALGRSASGASGGQSPSSGASGGQSPSKTLVAQSDGPNKHRGRKSALAKTARALRSARACTRTGVRVKKLHSKARAGKGIMRKKRKASVDKLKYKDIVHCELCGCLVRRDVLPRHQESTKCLRLRVRRGLSKQTSKK